MEINVTLDYYKAQAKENLESDSGKAIYGQRKIDVETFFGRMKRNFGVRRVHVRGEQGVRNDLGLLFMSINLSKLHGMMTNMRSEILSIRTIKFKNFENSQFTTFNRKLAVLLGLLAQPRPKIP